MRHAIMPSAFGTLLLLCAFAGAGHAGAPPPKAGPRYAPVTDFAPFEAMRALCSARWTEGSDFGAFKSIEQIGVEDGVPLYHAVMAKKARQAIVRGRTMDENGTCPIYYVGRASGGDSGDFLGDGRRLRAFVIPENDGVCRTKTDCTYAVIVRDDKKVFHSVGTTGDLSCDQQIVKTVKNLAGRDALEIECMTGIGAADYGQTLLIFQATEESFKVVLSVAKGVHTAEGGENEDGVFTICESDAAGYLTIVKRGESPILEAFVPLGNGDGEEAEGGEAVAAPSEGEDAAEGPRGTLFSYTWDPKNEVYKEVSSRPFTAKAWPKETCIKGD